MFVTHDRVFLDRLATGMVELDRGQLRRFPSNWAAYRAQKELLAVEEAQAEQFDKRLAQEEAWGYEGVRGPAHGPRAPPAEYAEACWGLHALGKRRQWRVARPPVSW